MKITCLVTVYNEERRIGNFLAHATKWADEVVVRDKCSTDATAEICRQYGVDPIQIPFSADGTQNEREAMESASHDWVFYMTASEIPTKRVIDKARELIASMGDELDMVLVPKILWSLGICSDRSPWHISYQPFLVNRQRVQISDQIHANFSAPKERTGVIQIEDDCFVAHMTHLSGESFLRKHLEYALREVESDEPSQSIIQRCCMNLLSAFKDVAPGDELWAQKCGWNVYFYSIMLMAEERGKDHQKTYDQIAKGMIAKDWSQDPVL